MAKAEVESEKYKLKALEGEKFWSNKLEMLKIKIEEERIGNFNEKLLRITEQKEILHAQIQRLAKINKMKEKQVQSLEKRLYDIVHEKGNAG